MSASVTSLRTNVIATALAYHSHLPNPVDTGNGW